MWRDGEKPQAWFFSLVICVCTKRKKRNRNMWIPLQWLMRRSFHASRIIQTTYGSAELPHWRLWLALCQMLNWSKSIQTIQVILGWVCCCLLLWITGLLPCTESKISKFKHKSYSTYLCLQSFIVNEVYTIVMDQSPWLWSFIYLMLITQ